MSLPLLHAGRTNPGLSAALDLRFALDKSLTAYRGPTPSFSRASTGSYFDGSGVLRYAAVNILTYSEDLTNAAWVNQNTTDSGNATISPDGKTTADSLIESATNSSHLIYQQANVASGTIYTFSVYLKANQRSFAYIQMADSSSPNKRFSALINISNGTIVTTRSLNSPTNTSSSISDAGNGWYRASITMGQSGGSIIYVQVAISDSSTPTYDAADLPTYSGNISNGIFIWGAQLEASSTVGTYVPTTSAANSAPRFNHTYNGTSWVSRGLLLEEQRSNISTYSEDFSNAVWTLGNVTISSNAVMAPDGNTTADAIVENSSNTDHIIYQSSAPTVSAGSKYVMSVFAKKGSRDWLVLGSASSAPFGSGTIAYFNLASGSVGTLGPSINSATITDIGNGWYRCCIFLTAAASAVAYQCTGAANANGTLPYQGNGSTSVYIWGFQLELGSFPTSYIGTTNSSVVRSADVCQITGSNFSGFWNMTEGSIAIECDRIFTGSADNYLLNIQNATGTNTIYGEYYNGNIGFQVYYGAGTPPSVSFASSGAGISSKLAYGFSSSGYSGSKDGSEVTQRTATQMGSGYDRFYIGYRGDGFYWNGHIARLRYYRTRLENGTLRVLST